MKVKIAELKNNLSRYVHRVRERGEVIVVCDRDRPVACLVPLGNSSETDWRVYRETMLLRAEESGIKLDIPLLRSDLKAFHSIKPGLAPDKRTDLNTIEIVRKDY
ncbi:MAG: type II toxin-antitoxin system prevent-host-death family antitoxin [Leptospirales bacterium]|nr:type II toxin-antitoxin system prevent-host-death family antitoxin [Leptospirales bacterium]